MSVKTVLGVTAEEFGNLHGIDKTTVCKHMRQGFCPWPRSWQNTGRRKHPLYRVWAGIKARCYCKTNQDYNRYGGRGITMCSRWYIDFENFLTDMGPSYHTRPH